MSDANGAPKAPLVKRDPLDLNRKVKAILVVFLGGVALLVVLALVTAFVPPTAESLGEVIAIVKTVLAGLGTALVAAYATKEREQ